MAVSSKSLKSMPLGFRFHPTDEELVDHYLRLKIKGKESKVEVIREVDVCKLEPWELPDLSVIKSDDQEWFFFCPRDPKYRNGHRTNRSTKAGFWKPTGPDRNVKSGKNLLGTKKTLVFYKGRSSKGERTNWLMHEYRANEKDLGGTKSKQRGFVLCRLFKKPDENTENLNCEEMGPTVSSPEATPSNVLANTGSDMRVGEQLGDKSDNSNVTCNVEDREAVADQHPQPEEEEHFTSIPVEPISHPNTGLGSSSMDSPVASDFGYNGMSFRDGTDVPDISFSDALLNGQDESESILEAQSFSPPIRYSYTQGGESFDESIVAQGNGLQGQGPQGSGLIRRTSGQNQSLFEAQSERIEASGMPPSPRFMTFQMGSVNEASGQASHRFDEFYMTLQGRRIGGMPRVFPVSDLHSSLPEAPPVRSTSISSRRIVCGAVFMILFILFILFIEHHEEFFKYFLIGFWAHRWIENMT